MELRHLRYFVAVAQAGSFRRAAADLHVAQPALSRRIAALEQEIGIPLFEPSSRRRALSAAGAAFFDDVRGILLLLDRAKDRAREVNSRARSTLRIAFTESASESEVIANFVANLRRAIPGVEIAMLPMPSWQVDALLNGRIDAGFLYLMPHLDPPVSFQALADHPVMAVLPRAHPLARRARIDLRDLAGSRLVMVSRGVRTDFHRDAVAACRKAGIKPQIDEVGSAATVASLVSVGMGVGLLTAAMRSRLPDGLVMRPLGGLGIVFQLGLAWCPEQQSALGPQLIAQARAGEPADNRAGRAPARRVAARRR
jgi:DNA-binding transcriptional LysR family regulator